MPKYRKGAPRSEIRREIVRTMGNLDMAINHLSRAAAWAEEGKRPEVGEYLKSFAYALYELQRAMERFLQEVLGYSPVGGVDVDTHNHTQAS